MKQKQLSYSGQIQLDEIRVFIILLIVILLFLSFIFLTIVAFQNRSELFNSIMKILYIMSTIIGLWYFLYKIFEIDAEAIDTNTNKVSTNMEMDKSFLNFMEIPFLEQDNKLNITLDTKYFFHIFEKSATAIAILSIYFLIFRSDFNNLLCIDFNGDIKIIYDLLVRNIFLGFVLPVVQNTIIPFGSVVFCIHTISKIFFSIAFYIFKIEELVYVYESNNIGNDGEKKRKSFINEIKELNLKYIYSKIKNICSKTKEFVFLLLVAILIMAIVSSIFQIAGKLVP